MTTRLGIGTWLTALTVVVLSTAIVPQASANDTAALLGGLAAGYLTYRALDRDDGWNRGYYQPYYVQPVPQPYYYQVAPDWDDVHAWGGHHRGWERDRHDSWSERGRGRHRR